MGNFMAQAKRELIPTDKLTQIDVDVITHISSFLPFPLCRGAILQKNRLLGRLAQYAAEGKVEQVARLVTIRPDLRTEVLFTLAGLGAQDQMELILKVYPADLLLSRPLRDISGAVFPSICLFQHAIWAKDVRYMANMMLDCLPKNIQGELIRLEMVRQYEKLMANGVVYQLKGVMHQKEHHFSLQPLITALETFVNEYKNRTDEQRKLHWCTVMSMAQTVLPAHIRHHYCDPEESFWDKPNFKKPKLKRSLEIDNLILRISQLWSEGLDGLGQDFGICGGAAWRGVGGHGVAVVVRDSRASSFDLAALKTLDNVRTSIDMPSLIKRLYTPIQNLEENLNVQGMTF